MRRITTMHDHMSINMSTEPTEERGPSVGEAGYGHQCLVNGRVFIKQLIRQFGAPPGNARLVVKGNPHDFGTYYTVDCVFDTESRAEVEYAFRLEAECPEYWDNEARLELGIEVE
jgi:hypothetical protein